MVVDIERTELRDFAYITSVFKCIANYNLKGHQIGRKIGDMLEILTMGALYRNADLYSRLSTEKKLEGFTTAGHKVEFGLFDIIEGRKQLFGAVECKCVGVEETTAGKNNRHLRKLSAGESFSIEFSGRWQPSNATFTCEVVSVLSDSEIEISISTVSQNPFAITLRMKVNECLRVVMDENNDCLVTSPNGNMLDEIPTIIRTCKTVRLQGIANGVATFALFDCLTGPQTIEKAKQASLVAMDLRKKVDGCWGKEEVPAVQRKMTFVHVLCEFSHWEEKSRNVIKTCIDHNVVVPDAVIIEAFEVFERKFGIDSMLDKISKNEFDRNPDVQNAIYSILDYFENKVFYDIELKRYVSFEYANGSLIVAPIH